MNITISTIPYSEMRYPTCGDYFYEGETLQIKVARMSNEKYEWLIAIHELVEVFVCKIQGISHQTIDAFDVEFEKHRQQLTLSTAEPGDAPGCPYRSAHSIASGVERTLAWVFGVDWLEYEREINALT